MKPLLTTQRFELQDIVAADQQFIYEGLSHPEVIPFYGVRYNSLEATKAQMDFYNELCKNETGYWWKIVDKVSGERVGAIGYNNYNANHKKAEVGYWLLPQFWKKGIISEVFPVVVSYLQNEKKIHRIEALVEDGNADSNRVLERAGFIYEGTLRDFEIKEGQYISLRMYSLLSTDKSAQR
jgi:[ribosomal protein S5]-alanine N-acetyltransferase